MPKFDRERWSKDMMSSPPITSGWGSRKFNTDGVTFRRYCNEQIKSLKVAIDRKSHGSTVEDGYFMEHLNKLKDFFLEHEVYK